MRRVAPLTLTPCARASAELQLEINTKIRLCVCVHAVRVCVAPAHVCVHVHASVLHGACVCAAAALFTGNALFSHGKSVLGGTNDWWYTREASVNNSWVCARVCLMYSGMTIGWSMIRETRMVQVNVIESTCENRVSLWKMCFFYESVFDFN